MFYTYIHKQRAHIGMKAKQNPDRKRNEIHIASTPLFSVFFHKGIDSFSIHRQWQKDLPATLIMVSRGNTISVKTGGSLPAEIHTNRCRLLFDKGSSTTFSYKGQGKWEFFEIRMSLSLLNGLPDDICPAWDSFMKKAAKHKEAIFSGSNLYYRNALKDTAYTLLNEPFAEAAFREKYFTVKLHEILLHVMHESLSLSAGANSGITDKEHMLTSKTKQILDKVQSCRDFTIQSIAEELDTNETTLKQSFKKVTGVSIYQYYLHKQMTLAQQLLNDGHPVSGVALKVGYSAIAHFSHQFKKYFGTSPVHFKAKL